MGKKGFNLQIRDLTEEQELDIDNCKKFFKEKTAKKAIMRAVKFFGNFKPCENGISKKDLEDLELDN